MSSVQLHQVVKKLAGQARAEGMIAAGSVAPRLVNLRQNELSAKLGSDEFKAQKQGAYERALKERAEI